MKIRVVDFETTGLPPDAAICQVGWTDVIFDTDGDGHLLSSVYPPNCMLVNPGRPIPPEARAVHHISDRDVADAPAIDHGFLRLMADPPDAFCAHNAKFEREFFAGGEVPWICTRKVGMRLWPDAPNFQNQTLRYFLGVDDDAGFEPGEAVPSHSAGPDSYVTAHILARAKIKAGFEEMVQWTNQPSLLPGAINFGKHKGILWSQCDPGYLDWMARQPDMDEDKVFTAKYWLAQRRGDTR